MHWRQHFLPGIAVLMSHVASPISLELTSTLFRLLEELRSWRSNPNSRAPQFCDRCLPSLVGHIPNVGVHVASV